MKLVCLSKGKVSSNELLILRPEVLINPENGLLNMGSILIKEEL